MVKCPNCGEENKDGLKVCLNCGYDLPGYTESEPEPERRKEPKEPKGVSPKPPKKSSHKLRNAAIILLIALVLFYIVANVLPHVLMSDVNQANSIQMEENYQESVDNDESSSSIFDGGNSLFSSTKAVSFDNQFTMEVDDNLTFMEYEYPEFGSSKEWETNYGEYVYARDERMFRVLYWDDVVPSELFQYLEDSYGEVSTDGDLTIFTHGYGTGDTNTFEIKHEYMACVVSENNRVACVSGVDFDKVKQFAKSIQFS